MNIKKSLAGIFLVLSAPGMILFAQEDVDVLTNLANQIAQRRARVEALSSELEMIKTEYNEQLRSLSTQKTDLETQLKREELRMDQLDRDIEDYSLRLEDNRASMEEIEPVVLGALSSLGETVKKGLPFQVFERQAEIDDLYGILEDGRVDTGTILARAWNMVESEFRLTSENGIYRQTIQVGGEEQLVEVARLGMVLMYFKTFDDRYGFVVPQNGEWSYEYVKDREKEGMIMDLFDTLRKNLREGFFMLPNPMAD